MLLNYTKFPAGEIKVKVDIVYLESNSDDLSNIYCSLKSSDDIMALLMTVDALRRAGHQPTSLYIKYFPYARQDRICNPGEAFSVKVMADLINGLNIPDVVIYEPHSPVTTALVNNSRVIQVAQNVRVIDLAKGKVIISPDAGAVKRAETLASLAKSEMVLCTKVRNTATGKIEGVKVYKDDFQQQDVLIIDDICDGGATFIEVAKALMEKNCGMITLVVAHGIFSKGLEVFKGVIDEVYAIDDKFNLVKMEY